MQPSESGRNIRPYLILVAVALAAYGWALSFGLAYLDDMNLTIRHLDYLRHFSTLGDAFLHSDSWPPAEGSYYRPITTVTHVIEALIAPGSTTLMHAFDVMFHITATLLVYTLMLRLRATRSAALLLGLLFAAHPAASNAVVWIGGRNDTLLAIFTVASLLSFQTFVETKRTRSAALAVLWFALALLSKETAVAIIPLCVLWLYVDRKGKEEQTRGILLGAGMLLLIAVWWPLRAVGVSESKISTWHIAGNLPALPIGFGKCILPGELSPVPALIDISIWWSVGSAILLGALLWQSRRELNWLRVAYGFAWFLAFMGPTLLAKFDVIPTALECRLYPSLIGLLIVASELTIVKHFAWRGTGRIVAVAIIAVFVALSLWYSYPYRSDVTFWGRAVESSPHSPMAAGQYGATLFYKNRYPEAEYWVRKGLEMGSRDQYQHSCLGDLLYARGVYDSAAMEYWQEIAQYPNDCMPWWGLGGCAFKTGKLTLAIEYTRKAVQINPKHIPSWKNLAILYAMLDDREQAAEAARRVAALGDSVSAKVRAYLEQR